MRSLEGVKKRFQTFFFALLKRGNDIHRIDGEAMLYGEINDHLKDCTTLP